MTQDKIDTAQHDMARTVIDHRWHKNFDEIATEMNIALTQITELQTTKPYEHQVWACYGRSPYLFNKHPKKEESIKCLMLFFGITEELARKVLGDDWERYRPEPKQLNIEFKEIQ